MLIVLKSQTDLVELPECCRKRQQRRDQLHRTGTFIALLLTRKVSVIFLVRAGFGAFQIKIREQPNTINVDDLDKRCYRIKEDLIVVLVDDIKK